MLNLPISWRLDFLKFGTVTNDDKIKQHGICLTNQKWVKVPLDMPGYVGLCLLSFNSKCSPVFLSDSLDFLSSRGGDTICFFDGRVTGDFFSFLTGGVGGGTGVDTGRGTGSDVGSFMGGG